MDRVDFIHNDSAEFEPSADPGLCPVGAVAGDSFAACYHGPMETDGRSPETASERPTKGTFLDDTIMLRDPEGSSFVTAVVNLLDLQRQLGRKQQPVEIENERNLVACVLANGLRCQLYRDPPVVAYQRKADGKTYIKPNKPTWLSALSLSRTTELFTDAGLLRLHEADWKTSSGYAVTDKLLSLAEEHGITDQSLLRCLHREDLIRLNSPKPKPIYNRIKRTLVRGKADRISFDPTPETNEMRDRIEAYNEFLTLQDICVNVPAELEATWVESLNEDETHTGMPLIRPELFRRAAYRVFNDGDVKQPRFDLGGRLAGPWWMYAPEKVRSFITINGEGTCELDYSACHPRMLYHELGLEGPNEPYDVPEVAEFEHREGFEPGCYRSGVKWVTQILINGRGRLDRVDVPKDVILPTDLPIEEFASMIERFHEPIASSFRTRAGLRLMRMESDIAVAIIGKAMEKGWVALSVHDSIICPVSHKEELVLLMINEYEERTGMKPIIH